MDELRRFLDSEDDFSNDQILEIFNLVGENGDVILIKNDGIRDTRKFTVVITYSGESIRYDDETISDALKKAVKKYLKSK